jgi:hypothetical protein
MQSVSKKGFSCGETFFFQVWELHLSNLSNKNRPHFFNLVFYEKRLMEFARFWVTTYFLKVRLPRSEFLSVEVTTPR